MAAKLDRKQLGRDYVEGASVPWSKVVERWRVFRRFVTELGRAIQEPFGSQSVHVLRTAEELYGDDTFMLAFALVHVAEALEVFGARRRRRRKPDGR